MRARSPSALGAFLVALASGAYAAWVLALAPGYQPSADSHYHFVVARQIAAGTLVPDVARGLPLTVLRDMPVDHYWGYHLLLAPFGFVHDPELGMKAATVVLFGVVYASMYLFLRARGVRHAWAWSLAQVAFLAQDWSYLQLRGGQLILPLLFALTQVAFFDERALRRRALLVVLGYAALLSYHGGIVLLPFHAAGVLALLLLHRQSLQRGQLFEPALTAAGMALGLTLNPYMDARASTWRFFALHVGEMGRDSAHLYEDQIYAEFHGFPASALLQYPAWTLLLVATLCAIVVAVRRERSKATIVLAGMAAGGIVLTALAMRTREYSVPVAFTLLALLAPRARVRSPLFASVLGTVLAAALVLHGVEMAPLLRTHLPSRQYRGARAILEANGDHPILNIAEADYCMLLWEYDRVVCVQALSRYFIYPYKELFHDIWELHDRADVSPETPAILRRFWDRGVRLVASHRTHKMMLYARAHPELLHPVFCSPIDGACIFALDPAVSR
ncbi:MAG TPA: hypothetical protein VF765_07915 [Polyangiaceae bacterium]